MGLSIKIAEVVLGELKGGLLETTVNASIKELLLLFFAFLFFGYMSLGMFFQCNIIRWYLINKISYFELPFVFLGC